MAAQQQTANEQGTTEQQQQQPTASETPIVAGSLAGPQEQAHQQQAGQQAGEEAGGHQSSLAQTTGWTTTGWRTSDQQAASPAAGWTAEQKRVWLAMQQEQAQQQRLNQLYQHLGVAELGAEKADGPTTKDLMAVLQGAGTAPAILIQTCLLQNILIKVRQLEKAVHFVERR